jgi:hypothetical protein
VPAGDASTGFVVPGLRHLSPIGSWQRSLSLLFISLGAADGSFKASELPEEVRPAPPELNPRIRLDSGDGAWKIVTWEGAEHLLLEFHAPAPDNEITHGSYGFPLTLSKRWSVVRLFYFLGDADQGPRMTFEKE